MAQAFALLCRLRVTMCRFFTVYGPWGRPDMAHFKFTRAILSGAPIEVYNHGRMQRDFTYIDDLIGGIVGLSARVPDAEGGPVSARDSLSPVAPFRVVNIGTGAPVALMDYIAAIEAACGREATKILREMQPGDVPATWADTGLLQDLIGPQQATPLAQGMQRSVDWYRAYYDI